VHAGSIVWLTMWGKFCATLLATGCKKPADVLLPHSDESVKPGYVHYHGGGRSFVANVLRDSGDARREESARCSLAE
jgi:hypothetical protein